MDKFEQIDSIAIQVDALIDMRGVEKCRTALEIIGKLNALRGELADEDNARRREAETYERRLRDLMPEDDGDTETIDGRTYRIGETAEG